MEFVQTNPVAVVVAVTPGALCAQAVRQLKTFLPDYVALAVIDINQNSQFQSHLIITVAPKVFVYKNSQLEAEFVLPFDQEKILCSIG
jgi:hypothetical protein